MRPTFAYRLSPICLLLAGVAHAQLTVSTTTNSNITTSTATNGTSPGDVTVTSTGTVSPSGGTGITIDSNNSVSNAGTVAINNVDNSIGIAAQGGRTGTITNSGTIRIDDAYAASDTNGDGVIDGPFAQGTGRYGITISGNGSFTGNIVNSGTVVVEGNNSAGISATVPILGGVQSTGSVSVLGDNGTAIRLGAVSGTVAISGAVTATGQNDVGLALTGNVGGQLVIHNTISATGYSATTAPTNTSNLGADNLLQGGSAVSVGGNVAGGILIGATLTATTDTTVDADADGIGDSTEGAGIVISHGAAPGLLIGSSTNAITLGVNPNGTSGLINNGTISGAGVYAGVSATGLQVGGLGQSVVITGGITNTGAINSSALGANSTAVLIGSGSSVPTLTSSGTIYGYAGTTAGGNAQAINIAAGASLPTITNSGSISAVVAVTGGLATAILDQSGTLTSVSNTGAITAGATDLNGTAINVAANTSGFTYTQSQSTTSTTVPSITGAILTGNGNDVITASAGTLKSNATLGAGNDTVALSGTAAYTGAISFGAGNDSLTLAGTSSYSGAVDFGSGADALAIGSGATFAGTVASAGSNVAVTVANGGTFGLTNTGTTTLSSLALGGTLAITADPASGTAGQVVVAGTTTISPGALLKVNMASLSLNPLTITVLRSGTLSGSANLGLSVSALPYLLNGSLSSSDANGTVSLTIGPRAVGDYGFRANEGAAYGAVYAAIASNTTLSTLFLGLTDRDSTVLRYRQMLPADYAGGTFDMLSRGTRILAPGANATPLGEAGSVNLWAQQAWWNGTQHAELTPGYSGYGWGLTGGADIALGGFGRFGLSVGYLYSSAKNTVSSDVSANDFQGGVHWIAKWGGLRVSANAAAGHVNFGSVRNLSSAATNVSATDLVSDRGHWNGLLLSGNAAASYEVSLGHFYARPSGTLNYAKLHEGQHSETGGISGFDLTIDSRNSSESSVTALLALGVQFGGHSDPEITSFRVEAEGGRRTIIKSNVGATTAHFAGGSDFTLLPEERNSGYDGALRLTVGNAYFDFSASAGAETRDGYHGLVGRLSLRASL